MTLLASEVNFNSPFEGPCKTQVEAKRSLFVHPNKVALANSSLYTGVNKHSGKRYFRWETTMSLGFYTTSRETVVPFQVSKDGRRFSPVLRGGSPFLLLEDDNRRTDIERTFGQAVQDTFGIKSIADVYPIADLYDCKWRDIPMGMHKHFRTGSMRDFAASVFGRQNVRRDLVKAMASTRPGIVALASQFKGLVPIDWIIGYLRGMEDVSGYFLADRPGLKHVLHTLDPRSYRHLLKDAGEDTARLALDIARYRRNINEAYYVRSWSELHNRLWDPPYVSYETKNEKIKLLPLATKLDGLVVDDLVFVAAKETDDLVGWGKEMRNCISGYAREATSGIGIYAAVERDNKVIANLEIRNDRLCQLLGKFNRTLPDDTKSKLVTTLNNIGVDTTTNWWGK